MNPSMHELPQDALPALDGPKEHELHEPSQHHNTHLISDVLYIIFTDLVALSPGPMGFLTTSSQKDILRSSRVCREWRAVALVLLYDHVRIQTISSAQLFLRTLETTTRGHFVHGICLGASAATSSALFPNAEDGTLATILAHCPNVTELIMEDFIGSELLPARSLERPLRAPLRTLQLSGCRFGIPFARELSMGLVEIPTLERLAFGDCDIGAAEQWAALPHLTSLVMVRVQIDAVSLSALFRLVSPHLEELVLRRVFIINALEVHWAPTRRLRSLTLDGAHSEPGNMDFNSLLEKSSSTLQSLKVQKMTSSEFVWPLYKDLRHLSIQIATTPDVTRLVTQCVHTLVHLELVAGFLDCTHQILPLLEVIPPTLPSLAFHAFTYDVSVVNSHLSLFTGLRTLDLELSNRHFSASARDGEILHYLPPNLRVLKIHGMLTERTVLRVLSFLKAIPHDHDLPLEALYCQALGTDFIGEYCSRLKEECISRGISFELNIIPASHAPEAKELKRDKIGILFEKENP